MTPSAVNWKPSPNVRAKQMKFPGCVMNKEDSMNLAITFKFGGKRSAREKIDTDLKRDELVGGTCHCSLGSGTIRDK